MAAVYKIYFKCGETYSSFFNISYTDETLDAAFDKLAGLMAEHNGDGEYVVKEVPWMDREAYWFHAGVYKPPPWHEQQWWLRAGMVQHFAHVSTEEPGMLAYTEDAAKGEEDRQTRIKPGKYLQKFFGASDKTGLIAHGPYKGRSAVLNPREIAYYAEWFEKGARPRIWSHLELKFATTPDEIADVYISGPVSCMGGETKFSADHPTKVYGAGDLHLAYLQDPKTGKICARALCWPDKAAFGRCYPAPENWERDAFKNQQDAQDAQDELRLRLKDKGWADGYEKADVLEGARLLKLKTKLSNSTYAVAMPYLDLGYGVSEHDDGVHLKMTRVRPTWGSTTGGFITCVPTFVCYHCTGRHPEVDSMGRENRNKVTVYHMYSRETGPSDPHDYCRSCAGGLTYMCNGLGVYFRNGNVRKSTIHRQTYVQMWANDQGAYTCRWDGERYLPTETPPVVIDGVTYAKANATRIAFGCAYDGEIYPLDQMSRLHPGMPAKYDADPAVTAEDRARCDFTRRTQVWDFNDETWRTVPTDGNPLPSDLRTLHHFQQIRQLAFEEAQDAQPEITILAAE